MHRSRTHVQYKRVLQFECLEIRELLSITSAFSVGQYDDPYGFDQSATVTSTDSGTSTPAAADTGAAALQAAQSANFASPAALSTASALSSSYPTVVVDPTDGQRLMNSKIYGEWSTAGNYDGWTVVNAASSSVSGGILTVTSKSGTSNAVQVSLTNISNGAYLDYGYFDYLQIRLQLPVNYNKDVTFAFGTTVNPGFSINPGTASDRSFVIPAAQIAKDGNFHTYRIDLGLVIWWRDTLHDLQIRPLGTTGAGETANIDYIEVGDMPGDVLTAYTTDLNMAPGVTVSSRQSVESKHFVFWWDPAVNPGGLTNWATMQRNALRTLEESYQVYTKVLGFSEPFGYAGDGLRHKINITTWYGGYWEGGGYLNIDTTGLQDESWGSPLPHEFAHVSDSQQAGYLDGGYWESHANFLREARTNWFWPFFPAADQSTMPIDALAWSNYRQDSPRLIYSDYRIWLALENIASDPVYGINGTDPLDPNLASELWMSGSQNWTVYDKLATLLPAGTSIKDVVASVLRLWPMLNFQTRSFLQAHLWDTPDDEADYDYRTGSYLIPEPDQAGWYRVPLERAPEKYAFMFHDLVPDPGSTSITVTLRGIDTIDSTEDWRWCLSEIDANNNVVAYSDVWAPGTHTFTLQSSADKVQLIVVATPSDTSEDLSSYYNTKPVDKSIDRLNYPYEVQITGATPAIASEQLNYAESSSGHYHSNGGGWVDNTATVAATAYVGPNARVLGYAKVLGNAKIEDYAVIAGSATVQDNAIVSGYSVVKDSAVVEGNARIRDHATIAESAVVEGNAMVEQFAYVISNTTIEDSAIVRGDAYPFGGVISGTAIADYDYSYDWSFSDGTHFGHFPWGDWFQAYYDATQAKPRGLVASYRVEESSGDLMWDEFGALDAILRGSPARVMDSSFNSQVLQLNGANQYALLDRSLADMTDATYGMWFKPTTTAMGQTLLYFGNSTDANTFLKLVARDANGFAHLTISVNGTVNELVSSVAIPVNQWTYVAVSFGSGTVTMYINGQVAGTLATTYRPTDVLGPDDYRNADPLYLGRDPSGDYFAGDLEDIRFYNVTLTPAEIANEISRAGAKIGEFFATTPMTFDGSTTMMESGVHNGLVRTLSAWIDPYASGDAGGYYQPILDSNDELNAGMYGSGFGLDNGLIKVRLDGLGMWNTGVPVQLNTWQQITLTFNGSIAKLYVNDILKASTAYTADPNNLAGKNYRIGWGQSGSDTSTRTFFDGQILDLQIYDRVTPIADPNVYCWDTQTTAGHQGGNGTWDSTGTNVDWSDGDGTTLTAWPAGSTDKTAAFATDSGNASWNISVTGNPTPLAIDFGDENGYSTDPYTLSGGTLGVGTGGITAYYSGAISAPVTLRGAQTWDAETGATLTVGGNINTSGYSLAFSGNGTTYVSGNISGNGSLTQQGGGATYLAGTVTTTGGVVQNGTGSLTLLGSGSALGPVSINQGTLVVGNGTTTTTSATSTSTAIGNGTTLDVKSGTYTMPGVSVGHDSQVGFIMLEGAGTLTSTAAITMGFNQGSASLVAQNNSVLNGGTNTLDMGTANASSVYVDLKNNARATFGNVNVASSNYYHDGQGSYAVLEVDDNASLSVSSTLTVGGYAGNTTLPAKLNGQLYQSGGTVAAKYVILGNDTADASDTLVGVYNLCGGTLQTAQISQGTRSASDYPGVAYFNFHGGTLAYNGTTSQSDFISLRANLASTVDIYEGATINSGTQSVTVSQPLLAPTGNGVASIDISGLSNPNQTYVVPPWVYISGGGGSGATAVATLDPVTHTVNGILVTNPGSGYTSTPTVQLIRTYDAIQTASAAKITMRANSVYSGGLTKIGAGSLSLTAASTYTGPTTIDAGTLFVSNTTGSGTGTDSVIVNSTLGGTGAIAGPVTVNASGSLAPGINGIGTLTVNNTLALSGTTVMEINKTTGTCDKIAGISTVTFGGTLTVMKLAGTLAAGDSFTLFSAAAYAGNFTTLNLPALAAGLRWDTSTLKTNGSIKVVVDAYPTVASPAACTLALDGKTAQLTVLGADDGGEPNLKYTWTVTSVPSGALSPTFSANGTNVAKNATVTFYQACTYNFTVAIADQLSQTVTSATSINVIQMPVTLAIGPSGAGLFSTTGTDQFGKPLTPATPFAWPTIGITAQRSGNSLHLYQTGTSDDLIPSYLAADLANLTFTGADDVAATLTIDESDGDLLMQTGGTVAFSGGAQDADAGNVLLLVGTSGDDNAVIGAAQIALNGWTPVAYANVRYFGFDLSGGTNSLLIDHATLNLNQDNAISAGTNVTIDGGILDLNTKTDTIGNLTLKSGSIVNGTIYANAYKIESGTVTAAITGPGDLQKTTTGLATTGVVNTSNVSVEAGQLTATSISTGTLTIGAGSIVTITPIPGGPLAANSTLTPLATRALRPTLRKPIAESTTAYTTIAPSSSTATITIAAEPLAASSTVLATPVPVSIEVASVLASSNSSSKTVLDVAAAPTAIVADIATQVSLTDSTSTILIGTAINRHRLQSPVYSWIDSTALNKIIEGGLQQSLTTSDGNITSKSILDSLSDELLSHVSKFAKHSTIPTINIRSAHLAALQTYSRWSYLDTEADFDIGRHVRAGKHSNQFEKAIDKVLAEEEDAIPALL